MIVNGVAFERVKYSPTETTKTDGIVEEAKI